MKSNVDPLHGGATQEHSVALLLVDVINPLDFPEAGDFLRQALPTIDKIATLKARAVAAKIPVIYANDNFGRWRSDLASVVGRCKEADSKGKALGDALAPDDQDYFVLKPKHSAFYSTTLDLLLQSLGTRTLITVNDTESVLRLMAKVLKAQICTSGEIDFAKLSAGRI